MSVTFGQIKHVSAATSYSDALAMDFMRDMASRMEELIPGSSAEITDTGFHLTWKGYTWKVSYNFSNSFGVTFDCYKSDDLTSKISTASCDGGRNYQSYPYAFWINYQLTKDEAGNYYLWFCGADGMSKAYADPQFCKVQTTDGLTLEGFTLGGTNAEIHLYGGEEEYTVNLYATSKPRAVGAPFVSSNFETPGVVVYAPVILTDTGGFPTSRSAKSLVYIASNKLAQSSSYEINGHQYHILVDTGCPLQYGTHICIAFDCGAI